MTAGKPPRVDIGRCRCPVCGSTAAHLRVSAKQLAYVTCNACNVQILARSDHSDGLLRKFHVVADAAVPAAAAAAAPVATVAAPAPASTPVPTPPPKRPALGWGMLR